MVASDVMERGRSEVKASSGGASCCGSNGRPPHALWLLRGERVIKREWKWRREQRRVLTLDKYSF